MNPYELTAFITTLAGGLARQLNTNQLHLISAVLTQLADTLATIATQREFCEAAEAAKTEEADRTSNSV